MYCTFHWPAQALTKLLYFYWPGQVGWLRYCTFTDVLLLVMTEVPSFYWPVLLLLTCTRGLIEVLCFYWPLLPYQCWLVMYTVLFTDLFVWEQEWARGCILLISEVEWGAVVFTGLHKCWLRYCTFSSADHFNWPVLTDILYVNMAEW